MWIPAFGALCLVSPHAAIALCAYEAAKRLRRRKFDYTIPDRDEALLGGMREVVDSGIDAENDREEEDDGFFGDLFAEELSSEFERLGERLSMPARRARWVVKAATMAKVKFGMLSLTEANELMVSDYIRKLMVEHGVRPSHIVQLYPLAVALAFNPSSSEIAYSRLKASAECSIGRLLVSGPWKPAEKYKVGEYRSGQIESAK